jgi:hypothetical protein
MTNHETVEQFLVHKTAEGPISTDGKELKSFGQTIAKWIEDGIVMPDASSGSITTRKHRNLVRRMAVSKGIKVTQIS